MDARVDDRNARPELGTSLASGHDMVPEQVYRAWFREAARRRERITADAAFRRLIMRRRLELAREVIRVT